MERKMIRISKILQELEDKGLFTNKIDCPVYDEIPSDSNYYDAALNMRVLYHCNFAELSEKHQKAISSILHKYDTIIKIEDINPDNLSYLERCIVEHIGTCIRKDQLTDWEKRVYFPEDIPNSKENTSIGGESNMEFLLESLHEIRNNLDNSLRSTNNDTVTAQLNEAKGTINTLLRLLEK